MPLSRVLFRYVWPFWLFRDATRGDRYARAAAYRHNRDMRIHLPGYLLRWLLVAAAVFVVWRMARGARKLLWTLFGIAMALYWSGAWALLR